MSSAVEANQLVKTYAIRGKKDRITALPVWDEAQNPPRSQRRGSQIAHVNVVVAVQGHRRRHVESADDLFNQTGISLAVQERPRDGRARAANVNPVTGASART